MNQAQQAINQLMLLAETPIFPARKIVDFMEANPQNWMAYYCTLHDFSPPGHYSVYNWEADFIITNALYEIEQAKPVYNKMLIWLITDENGHDPRTEQLKLIAIKEWGADRASTQVVKIRRTGQMITILKINWYKTGTTSTRK